MKTHTLLITVIAWLLPSPTIAAKIDDAARGLPTLDIDGDSSVARSWMRPTWHGRHF